MLPDKSPATTNAQVSGYLRRATTLSAEDLPKLQKEQQPSQLMTEPSGLNTSAGRGTTRLRSRSLLTVDTSAPSGSTPVEGMPDTTHADDGQVLSSPVVDQLPPDSALSATSEQSLLQIPARDSHYRSSRPRSSSLNHYLPSPNALASKSKNFLSRWSPMRQISYVSVPSNPPCMSRPELDEPPRLHGHLHSGVAPNLMSGTEEDAILARPGVYSLLQPMVILLILFLCCTGVVVYLVSTIPVLSLPHNLREVLDQAIALKHYSRTSFAASLHVLFVLSTLFVYKQAFSIPGSLLSNCLFGSLYGVTVSTLLTSVLTAIGSMGCYYMAGKTSPLFHFLFPKALRTLQTSISDSKDVFSHLLLIRLFPLLPYAMLNIAAGVIAVPAQPFFWTLVLGSAPFNAVTTQIGDILASLPPGAAAGDLTSIWTPGLLVKLLCISAISALPVIFKKQIKQLLGNRSDESSDSESGSPTMQLWPASAKSFRCFRARRRASLEGGSSGSDDDELFVGTRSSEDYTGEPEMASLQNTPVVSSPYFDIKRNATTTAL